MKTCNSQLGDSLIKVDDRTIERGLAHVRIYTTKKMKCDEPEIKETVVDRTIEEEEQAPYVIVVHGPIKVGKSSLIKSLMKHYSTPDDPAVTLVLGNRRRIQFVECPNNVNGMIDAAKYAEAVVFMIDARYGFEMETFEFLNILRVHGIPKIIGVLTFLDGIGDDYKLPKTKYLKDRFFAEIYEATKLFCLSGVDQGMYLMHEIGELANYIMNMEFHPSLWRAQPYVLTNHFVDVTPLEMVNRDEECARHVYLYGYLRGCDIKKENKVHIAGVGDFPLFDVIDFPDPFPLPAGTRKKRRFQDDERSESEGFRTGTYLRLEVQNVPSEMVKNLNPRRPILVGFIGFEENAGYMQVTLKLHDWHRKLLKSSDPIIVSSGWRRYQTIPTYAIEGCHGRLEKLDYTPKDKQCLAVFWGPSAPPKTSVVMVQSLSDYEAAFRILATAVVLNCNLDAKIFEKRTLIGTPCKILNKTALIQNMFTSRLQIGRCKYKRIQTESGIPGKIIKAAEKRLVYGPEMKDCLKGVLVKCRFDREILMSDTVFMSLWTKVEVPRDFKPLMAASKPCKCIWHHLSRCDKVKRSRNPALEVVEKEEEPESKCQRLKLSKKLKESFVEERRKKLAAGWRETRELKRAVRIVEGEPSVETTYKRQWTCGLISENKAECSHEVTYGSDQFLGKPECNERSGPRRDNPILVAPRQQPSHGTTVIILNNAWGVFIISDGCVFTETCDFSCDELKDKDVIGQVTELNHKKTYILGGGRLLVTGAGDTPWVYSILDHLKLVAHDQEWTALQCAKFAKFHMTSGFGHHAKYSDLNSKDMEKLGAHMVFATFEDGHPSLYFADKNQVKEIVRYNEGSKGCDEFFGYKCLGTGSAYLDQVFSDDKPNHGESLQESMLTLLKLMNVAVKWDSYTDGFMEIHHMNRAGVVKVVPPFAESEIETFIAELGGDPFNYAFTSESESE